MSSIVTKTGDWGETRLYSGELTLKSSNRIVALGYIDELVSYLGLVHDHCSTSDSPVVFTIQSYLKGEVTYIQQKLFNVASEIATLEPKLSKLPHRIDGKALIALSKYTSDLEKSITLPKGFILPGANKTSAYLDICRCLCRKCEPPIVTLFNDGEIENPIILKFMNRLSDYLYLLARYSENNE